MSVRLIDPTAGREEVDAAWATPSRLRPLFYEDPALVWLEHHGAAHGFMPDAPSASLMAMLERKGREFERAWLSRVAPEAETVCAEPWEARQAGRVRDTLALMERGAPVIAQPALWWPDVGLYGAPDLIVLAGWLRERLGADLPADADGYVVIDLKFTSKLDAPAKQADWRYYSAQVRLYSFMLGQIQGWMPPEAYLVTRDRLLEPLAVAVGSQCGGPLDPDLAERAAEYRRIASEGGGSRPWRDGWVACNHSHRDERWARAKQSMLERVEGGAVERMWYVGPGAARKLLDAGIGSLRQLMDCDPDQLPKGVLRRRPQMLAIMEANRSGRPLRPAGVAPAEAPFEFFVDCEYFSSVNVDFDREWPELRGLPIIFMLGVGWVEGGAWRYRDFVAAAETLAAERALLCQFADFLLEQTGGELGACALYHWSHADPGAVGRAVGRQGWGDDHLLRGLDWRDLEAQCVRHACALPGAWSYSLKAVARALADWDASYDPAWPDELDDGGMAQVLGWQSYQCPAPLESDEMKLLRAYLAADCRAVRQVLRWLREERHDER